MKPKILLVSMLYDYGMKERGYSYDYYNMYDTLKHMFGENALFFDFMTIFQERGKRRMNELLLEFIRREKPDLSIFSLYTDQFIPEVLGKIREYTKTLCYFWDDQWRINFATFWARYFDFISTPDFNGIKKWHDRGFKNVIYSPFGCNHYFYKRKDLPKIYDVSFVGMYHPYRRWLIKRIEKAGIKVSVFGWGWGKNSFVSYEDVVNIFNQSKINLNFSNSISLDIRYVFSSLRTIRNTLKYFKSRDVKNKEQIKGRHFEICGCGGFQLSYYVEGIEHCYEIDREISIYTDVEDLVEKIEYYLSNDKERQEIAEAGYKRTLLEHTYEKRLKEILEFVGI